MEAVSKRWFDRFAEEMESVAEVNNTTKLLGPHVLLHSKPMLVEVPEGWPEDIGWYVEVGAILGSKGNLSVWLDRYLDPRGDAHLGVWYEGSRKAVRELADKIGVPAKHRYTWEHRDHDGILRQEFARLERARQHRWVVDEWKSEAFLGMYVVVSPHLSKPCDVVGPVCAALRVLADALVATRRPDASAENDNNTDDKESQRYWELVERLARPGQARFRNELLIASGFKCIITGCADVIALDAAHIKPVSDFGRDTVGNGLILRADLHRLFDAGLLTLSADKEPRVLLARRLMRGKYKDLLGAKLCGALTVEQRKSLDSRNENWFDQGIVYSL